jgi:hypothetical protein
VLSGTDSPRRAKRPFERVTTWSIRYSQRHSRPSRSDSARSSIDCSAVPSSKGILHSAWAFEDSRAGTASRGPRLIHPRQVPRPDAKLTATAPGLPPDNPLLSGVLQRWWVGCATIAHVDTLAAALLGWAPVFGVGETPKGALGVGAANPSLYDSCRGARYCGCHVELRHFRPKLLSKLPRTRDQRCRR